MPVLELLRYYLWITPHLLQIGIAVIMFRRGLARLFPCFFAYTCFEVFEFALLFTAAKFHIGTVSYFSLYSIMNSVSTILRFGILMEILRHLASSYPVLDRVLKPMFRWAAVVLLVGALMLAVFAGGKRTNLSWFAMNMLDRTVLILQTGLLAGLFVFSRYMTLSWRNQVFGIALGLGVYATADLIIAAILTQTGFARAQLLDYVGMAAYHGSVVIWIYYLLKPERVRLADVHELPAHDEVEVWNQELDRLLNR